MTEYVSNDFASIAKRLKELRGERDAVLSKPEETPKVDTQVVSTAVPGDYDYDYPVEDDYYFF